MGLIQRAPKTCVANASAPSAWRSADAMPAAMELRIAHSACRCPPALIAAARRGLRVSLCGCVMVRSMIEHYRYYPTGASMADTIATQTLAFGLRFARRC